jgi:hypothetical protein
MISNCSFPRSGTIEADLVAAAWRPDRISGETFTIFHVVDLDVLKLPDPGSFQQFIIDPAGALIVKIRASDLDPMQLCLKKRNFHESTSYDRTATLANDIDPWIHALWNYSVRGPTPLPT